MQAHGLDAEGHISLPSAAEGDDTNKDMLRLDHSFMFTKPSISKIRHSLSGRWCISRKDKVSI
jgi:hypothetical protein